MGKIGNTELYTFLLGLANEDYIPITRNSDKKLFNVPIGILFGFINGREIPELPTTDVVLEQNNLIPTLVTSEGTSGFQSVSQAVNQRASFEVSDQQILHVENSYQSTQESGEVFLMTDYYLLAVGKGSYGSGGTQLSDTDFRLIRTSVNNILPPSENGDVVVYNIGRSDVGGDNSVNGIVDTEDQVIEVGANDDVYVSITQANSNFEITRRVYRYVGASGTYGLNSGNTTVIGDYQLLEERSNALIATSEFINNGSNGTDKYVEFGDINAENFIGAEIPLNRNTTFFNTLTAQSHTAYVLSTLKVLGADAKIWINTASQPVITGAVQTGGVAWEDNTDMDLIVQVEGGRVIYFFVTREIPS